MLQKTSDSVYSSSLLAALPLVVHGYSTRHVGDTKKNGNNLTRFLRILGVASDRFVAPEQIHGNRVALLERYENIASIPSVDGVVLTKSGGDEGITLGTFAADCVPLLFVDPEARVLAVAHAGWRGTLARIAERVVLKMISAGAEASNILVSVGPHIELCCYSVPEDRAQHFLREFDDDQIALYNDQSWRISLGRANFVQLLKAGLRPEHIDAPAVCTSCQINEFFSYRKDDASSYGEHMGAIAWRKNI